MYEGLTHPLSSRVKINVIHSADERTFAPVSAEIEIWKDYEWKLMDACYQGLSPGKSVELLQNECMYMVESFLMGENIDAVRERYGVEQDSEDVQDDSKEDVERENILRFVPKQD
jgi:hypothetical protein